LGWDLDDSEQPEEPTDQAAFSVPPTPLPTTNAHRSYNWVVLAVAVLVVGAGGGAWFWATSATRPPIAVAAQPQQHGKPQPKPVVAKPKVKSVKFGAVHASVPTVFVKAVGASKGTDLYGNAARRPSRYLQLSRSSLKPALKPSKYTADALHKLALKWQAAAVKSATSKSCPKPTAAKRTENAKKATVDLVIVCKNAKGAVTTRVDERIVVAVDTLAYRGRVVASSADWANKSLGLTGILPTLVSS
jgi:hypothetical protein